MKYTELDAPKQDEEMRKINARVHQLSGLVTDASEQGIKFLFLTNAGGAIAVLSFIGTSDTVNKLVVPKIALGLFALGIILNGALLAFRLHKLDLIFNGWLIDVKTGIKGALDLKTLYERDYLRTNKNIYKIHYFVGYGSAFCFIAGVVSGFYSLISL